MRESRVVNQVIKRVGGAWNRLTASHKPGEPDHLVVKHRRAAYVEFKRPGESAKAHQIVRGNILATLAGGIPYFIIDDPKSPQVENLESYLDGH